LGLKGYTTNIGKKGIRQTVSLPGSGLSVSTQIGTGKRKRRPKRVSQTSGSDAAATVATIISMVCTIAMGLILPAMRWWVYLAIFFVVAAVLTVWLQILLGTSSPSDAPEDEAVEILDPNKQ